MSRVDLFGEPCARGAVLDSSGLYRYRLWRTWSPATPLVFVMLNPSTADAEQDDPTIRRCVGFARREGAGGIEVVNLFAYRATNPKVLRSLPLAVAVGPENDRHIMEVARKAGHVVLAMGAHGRRTGRHFEVYRMLEDAGIALRCFGQTASGAPRHPLYLPRDAKLEPFEWIRAA